MTRTNRAAGVALAGMLAAGAALSAPATHPLVARAANPCPTIGTTALTANAAKSGSLFTVCNGTVKTFDGTPLDVDVTIPTFVPTCPVGQTVCPPPLVMLLSGWSNDICQFESLTPQGSAVPNCGTNDYIGNPGYDWNNAWFASKGWVALTYTPRGWYESCGKVFNPQGQVTYSYATDSACSSTPGEASWAHLYDRRYEIRDAQYLAGLIADAGLVNPQQILTTGDSGGGGPSWDLALSQDKVVQLASTVTPAVGTPPWTTNVVTLPWTSPAGKAMHLAASVPMFTWTDLVDSLVSNGTSSDCVASIPSTCFAGKPADGTHDNPPGVEKQSYVAGLFVKGVADIPTESQYSAQYATPSTDPTADLFNWFVDINAGEPTFNANPAEPTILAQIGGPLRSPFAIPVPATDQIPVFAIQGDTDPLFPSTQALTMINRLKSVSSAYPVWGFLGDVGHSYAQNPLATWQKAHDLSNSFLTAAVAAQSSGQPINFSQQPATLVTDTCAGQAPATYTGPNLQSIATSVITLGTATGTKTTTSASDPASVAEGAQLDPIANSGCPALPSGTPSSPQQATYTFPVTSGFTLVGGPVVNVTSAALTGASSDGSAELAGRLFDVDAGGKAWLVGRTVYRFDPGSPTSTTPLSFELPPNGWQFCSGDTVKLELTQVDTPSWRLDNEQSTISLTGMQLSLPAVAGTGCLAVSTPEAPLAPAIPLAALIVFGAAALVRRRRRLA